MKKPSERHWFLLVVIGWFQNIHDVAKILLHPTWIPDYAKLNAEEAKKEQTKTQEPPTDPVRPRPYPERADPLRLSVEEYDLETTRILERRLTDFFKSITPPALSILGVPNEDWILHYAYSHPELSREQVEAKLLLLVAREDEIIDSLVARKGWPEATPEENNDEPRVQVKTVSGTIHVKLFGEWHTLSRLIATNHFLY